MKSHQRPAYHEQDPPFQLLRRYPLRGRSTQDFPDKFIAPRSVHEINHLRLILYPNVALEAYEDRPVIWSNRISYCLANFVEWDALAEGVSVSDYWSFC